MLKQRMVARSSGGLDRAMPPPVSGSAYRDDSIEAGKSPRSLMVHASAVTQRLRTSNPCKSHFGFSEDCPVHHKKPALRQRSNFAGMGVTASKEFPLPIFW